MGAQLLKRISLTSLNVSLIDKKYLFARNVDKNELTAWQKLYKDAI